MKTVKKLFAVFSILLLFAGCAETNSINEGAISSKSEFTITAETTIVTTTVTTTQQTTETTTAVNKSTAKTKAVTTAKKTEAATKKAAQSGGGKTVYIAPKSGKKYHYKSQCGNGKYVSISIDEAKAKGYTPCKKCAGG